MDGTAPTPAFKVGAKSLDEEAPRGLSGNGFLTEGREKRRMSFGHGDSLPATAVTSSGENPRIKFTFKILSMGD